MSGPDEVIAAKVRRAVDATDEEHAEAIRTLACPICGAAPGTDCTYNLSVPFGPTRVFAGRCHLRRVRALIEAK